MITGNSQQTWIWNFLKSRYMVGQSLHVGYQKMISCKLNHTKLDIACGWNATRKAMSVTIKQ